MEKVQRFETMEWLNEQMQWMPSCAAAMLLHYLTEHAFHTPYNAEDGEMGQVLYKYSSRTEMMHGTAIRSHSTLKRALRWLRKNYYITVESRGKPREPMVYKVLWWTVDDEARTRIRSEASPVVPTPTPPVEASPMANIIPFRKAQEGGHI